MFFNSGLDNDNEVNDETFLSRLRHWRNKELARTDWTQVADAPVDKTAWATYRQQLRDLPQIDIGDRNILLPEPPTN